MRSSDLRREENYNEYLRLLQDDDYYNVTFDDNSGGVSAIHLRHKFAKQQGISGMRRSDYERIVLEVLRKKGYRIILAEETNEPGVKSCDGFLDDTPMEIKAIEGSGIWTICSKLRYAEKQHAQCAVLFFPDKDLYSAFRVSEGIRLFNSDPNCGGSPGLKQIIIVVEERIVAVLSKKTTPIEGW
ncbi:MAG: hypothetical protein IJS70_04715, partial [Bacteroidales bacterium]|nr:hypothetical protein [Bacteroidales bacterium]